MPEPREQQIISGNGYVEFTALKTTTLRYLGLRTGNTGTDAEEIRFAIRLQPGIAAVRENGLYRADTRFVTGNVFRIAVESKTVKHHKNSLTSAVAATYPTLVDTAILDLNATINNAMIFGTQ